MLGKNRKIKWDAMNYRKVLGDLAARVNLCSLQRKRCSTTQLMLYNAR